jgi:hypothetical protein
VLIEYDPAGDTFMRKFAPSRLQNIGVCRRNKQPSIGREETGAAVVSRVCSACASLPGEKSSLTMVRPYAYHPLAKLERDWMRMNFKVRFCAPPVS